MRDARTERKWDRAAGNFDRINAAPGPEERWRPVKEALFGRMGEGRVLFVGVGTGLDFRFFPPGKDILGIDISSRMLEQARPRAAAYPGTMELRHADVHELDDPPGSFAQAFTSCTFCSVPNPVHGLERIRGVLGPGGELHMFEHTGSRFVPYGLLLKLMTPLSRRFGPDLDRDTVENVRRAGFELESVEPHFLDVVKSIHAVVPAAGA